MAKKVVDSTSSFGTHSSYSRSLHGSRYSNGTKRLVGGSNLLFGKIIFRAGETMDENAWDGDVCFFQREKPLKTLI